MRADGARRRRRNEGDTRVSKATKMVRERRQRALFLDGAKENEEEEKRGVLGKDEDQQRGGFSLSEEEEGKEEEEEDKDQSLHRATVSTPRMGYESVQRRLVEWKKQQRQTTKGEEEEEEEGETIEIQKRKNEEEENEEAMKRRAQMMKEEEKRTRKQRKCSGYLEQMPWKSPRLTARSARRREKEEEDERRERCERKRLINAQNAAEIYAKRCNKMHVRVSSRVLNALENEVNNETFDVSKEPLGDGGAVAVASAIQEGSAEHEALIFAKCQVGLRGFHAICESALQVSKRYSVLKVLDLSDSIGLHCAFEDGQNSCHSKPPAAVSLLLSVLYQLLERLKVLKLNGCKINSTLAKPIADALISPKCTVEILELSRNALGNRGAKKIGDALITNRTLKVLDVSLNAISSRGCVSIANGTRENSTLKELCMSWNAIGDIGGKALGEALASNRALRTLDISQCAIGEDATCAISKGLRKNTTLKVLKMDHTRCGETGGKKLMAMLTRNDCLTTLTLEGASFAGAKKVEEKGRQRQTQATVVNNSSAPKSSDRSKKQQQQKVNNQKKGRDTAEKKRKTSKATIETKKSTREDYENSDTALLSSSSSEEDEDEKDGNGDDYVSVIVDENEVYGHVLRTPRGSARNSNSNVTPVSEKLPLSELILPAWSTSGNSLARQTPIDEEDLLNLLQQLRSNRLSDFERVSRLQMVRSAYLFTSAQVARLTQTFFLPSSHRLAAAAACQPRLIDSENAIDVIYLNNGFGFRDYASANRKLEQLYGERNAQFRSQNPNGRYRFDLVIDADRALAQRMADIANEESSKQQFGGKCWRNVSVDDGPCVSESMCEKGTGIPKIFFSASSSSEKRRKRTKTLKLPERGTLAFDFSSVSAYFENDRRPDDDDYSMLKLIRDVSNVEAYLFDENGKNTENSKHKYKTDGELYAFNLRILRVNACTLWFTPSAAKNIILYFPKGAFRVEAIVALFGRIPLHLRDDFSREVFSLGQLSGVEQCVLGLRLGWRSVLGTRMEQLTFRCRLDCTCEEDLNVAKYLCEKASEANADAHCRVRNVLVNDRRLAKDPVQDASLWSVLTAESSTPLLEFDYFGEDEDVLNSLLERELAPVVQNGNTSARGREQSAPSTTGTKKESSFNLQLRKFSNKLNFTRACEVHRWRQNNLVKVDAERSKVAEKNSNSNNNNTTSANKKLKKKVKEKKKKPEIPSATSPPVSSPSLSSTTTGGNPYETFYASYFSSPSSSSFESNNNNNNNNVLKHIFSSLDQDGGGTLSLYEFKKGATDVLGVKIDRKILEPYFPIRRSSEHQNNEQQKDTNNTNNKIDFRAFQEGVVEYDTFEKICSEWMEREEATRGVLNRKYNSFS